MRAPEASATALAPDGLIPLLEVGADSSVYGGSYF
jgi:hypothetical protein